MVIIFISLLLDSKALKNSHTSVFLTFGMKIALMIFLSKSYVLKFWGIVTFVTSLLMGRFVVFFTVDFFLFLAPAVGSNTAGPIN